MFIASNDNLKEPERKSAKIKGEFAISFSRMPDDSYLLCHHDISNDAVIGKGKPISFSALEQAVTDIKLELLKESEVTEGADPNELCWTNNVLFRSEQKLIWYRPYHGKTEKLWFRSGDGVCVDAKVPTLVFAFDKRDDSLRVYSSIKKTVNRKTALYHAPLCNIGSTGKLCFGSAEQPNRYASEHSIIQVAEAAIFESMFTHVNHKKTFLSQEDVETTDHIRIWKELSKSNRMPTGKDMVKANLIVEQLVTGL